jgi:type IV secretion system protein TrbJ
MKHVFIAIAVALSLLTGNPAQAQRIVFDPTNFSQNILTAARTLQTVNNQIIQLQNEALMLINQARNLSPLNWSGLAELRQVLAATNELIQQGKGLAFTVSHLDSDFKRLYPLAYASGVPGVQMALDAREQWRQTLEAVRTSTRVQAQAMQNFASDERTLSELVQRSQSAVGALQAMQANNQLLALQSRQTMQTQQLQITQDRAAALEQARQVAVQERAREVRRRFTGEGTAYTPPAVSFYAP